MSERLHATTVLVGERAVLIRGPSGSGKSSLALALLARPPVVAGTTAPAPVRLVADDQTLVEACGGRLIARPHPVIAGRIEMRGMGLLSVVHEPQAVVGLVVLLGDYPRLPSDEASTALICGVRLPTIGITPRDSDPVGRVLLAYRERVTAG
jgi:HPr kinase/phosphorylase